MALKYKVGDRVRIKSLDWYNENKDENGNICYKHGNVYPIFFTKYMSRFCGETLTIKCVHKGSYYMNETGSCEFWTDEMIEGLAEEETKFGTASNPLDPKSNANCLTWERVDALATKIDKELPSGNQYVWELPDGYQFTDENGNVINATKIVLEKKKKEYPKTYEECCEVLEWNHRDYDRVGYKSDLLCKLQVLILCRDAYWKIAGEEMGLGEPWELSIGTPIYYIYYNRTVGTIKNDYADDIQGNIILAFPTAEMRDEFYENFKELINECKELL